MLPSRPHPHQLTHYSAPFFITTIQHITKTTCPPRKDAVVVTNPLAKHKQYGCHSTNIKEMECIYQVQSQHFAMNVPCKRCQLQVLILLEYSLNLTHANMSQFAITSIGQNCVSRDLLSLATETYQTKCILLPRDHYLKNYQKNKKQTSLGITQRQPPPEQFQRANKQRRELISTTKGGGHISTPIHRQRKQIAHLLIKCFQSKHI